MPVCWLMGGRGDSVELMERTVPPSKDHEGIRIANVNGDVECTV